MWSVLLVASLVVPVVGAVVLARATSAAASTGTTWTAVTIPSGLAVLNGVDCPSSTTCVAVGATSSSTGGAIETTNSGASWSTLSVPSGTPDLKAVSCSSASNCVAVGGNTSTSGVILHQASTAGAFVAETEPSQLGQLSAVSCVSGGSTCYTTGIDISDGYPDDIASSSNSGVTWSFDTTAGVSGDLWISINAIRCMSATTCLLAGASYDGPIFAWTSNGWSSYSSGEHDNGYSAYLDALACPDSSFCLAVGRYAHYTGPVTGGSWGDETRNPGSPAQGLAAVCVSSSTCAFVGTTSGYPASGGPAAVYTTSNAGSTWQSDSVPSSAYTLFGVACSPGGLCFAVGQDSSSQALVLVDTGDALTAMPPKAMLAHKNPWTKATQPACADPVDCATGDFFETYTDAEVAGIGPNLSLTRTYNSLAGTTGIFGYGWSCSYCMSLAIDPTSGQATVTQEDGSTAVFPASGSGTFYAPSWEQATLVQDGNGDYTFTRGGTEIFTFSFVRSADLYLRPERRHDRALLQRVGTADDRHRSLRPHPRLCLQLERPRLFCDRSDEPRDRVLLRLVG
jgi:hypothetical protein